MSEVWETNTWFVSTASPQALNAPPFPEYLSYIYGTSCAPGLNTGQAKTERKESNPEEFFRKSDEQFGHTSGRYGTIQDSLGRRPVGHEHD